jgi:hypothetical protein
VAHHRHDRGHYRPGFRLSFARRKTGTHSAFPRQSMIPKSGNRFSDKIMLKQKDKRRV